ncbi:MAG: DUF3520 domain-containing protein [Deltaproteobacteria bacterium]|nr:MAG: DUF3520 domain-containing protein [Deltaproteobacteria bacterium]
MQRHLALLSIVALVGAAPACGDFGSADSGGNFSSTDTTSASDTASGDAFAGTQWQDPGTVPTSSADTATYYDTATAADASSPSDTAVPSHDTTQEPGPDTTVTTPEPTATNPFVVAEHDPFSTFGADVDTASYEIFKRHVQDGQLPDPSTVRLEEFVNYFHYDYPAPEWEAERPFNVAVEAAPSAFSETTLLRVGIQGKVVPPEVKPPANLVFLVDVSGSMASPDKLELVKVLLRETLNVLDPDDTVAIVTYASQEKIVLPATRVADAELIRAKINSLAAGGSTAGAQGLQMAYDVAQAGWIEGGVNHVLLCTDGDFNVGISDTDALVDFISEKRQSGITLTVVGFGTGNLNDSMMEAVSNAGDGVYSYIGDADSAVVYANTRMLGSLFFIAKDLKIQLAFNPATVYAYRLLGYENNAIADVQFVDDTVDAGEIGSGHSVTALYELVLAGQSVPEPAGAPVTEDGAVYDGEDLPAFAADDLVEVRVRYKEPGATVEDPAIPIDYMVATHRVFASFDDAGDDLRWAAAIAAFAEILKGSPYGDVAHLDLIGTVVGEQADADPDRGEFSTLFQAARALLAQ